MDNEFEKIWKKFLTKNTVVIVLFTNSKFNKLLIINLPSLKLRRGKQ